MLYVLISSLYLLLPTIVFGQVTYAPLIEGGGLETDSIGAYINSLYLISISIAALLATIKLIIAGAKYMLSDVVTTQGEAKKEIQSSLLGLLLVISAVLILTIINPDLISNQLTIQRVERANIPASTSTNQPAPGSRAAAEAVAAAAGSQVSGNCNERIITEDDNYQIITLDFTGCAPGDFAPFLGAFSRECISNNGGMRLGGTDQMATCAIPKEGTINTRYGSVTQNADTVRQTLTRFDAVAEAAEFANECEDKFGNYSISNGPTGTIAGATVTCVEPTIISYSGNTRQRDSWRGDCRANNGTYDENIFTPDYCIVFPR